jgi:hypothetical protein
MSKNLIKQLKEEWNQLDPIDPLRGLISDAIDALQAKTPQRQPLTDEQVIRGGEAVSDALRKIGMAVSDEDLNATEIEQEIAEYVFTQMQEAKLKE